MASKLLLLSLGACLLAPAVGQQALSTVAFDSILSSRALLLANPDDSSVMGMGSGSGMEQMFAMLAGLVEASYGGVSNATLTTRNFCSASSPQYCFVGESGMSGGNDSAPPLFSAATRLFSPPTAGAACACLSWPLSLNGTNMTFYAVVSADLNITGTGASTCFTANCNCPTCPVPAASCPAAGSSGPLKCRVGQIAATPNQNVTAAYPGNLLSQTFPNGSVCMSFSYADSTTRETRFYGTSLDNCMVGSYVTSMDQSGTRVMAGCAADNCAGPAPTSPSCPASTSATSCTVGMTGPSAALSFLQMAAPAHLKLPNFSNDVTPAAVAVPANSVCVVAVLPCTDLVAIPQALSALQCPSNSSVTVYSYTTPTMPTNFISPFANVTAPDYVAMIQRQGAAGPAASPAAAPEPGPSTSTSTSNLPDVLAGASGCLPVLLAVEFSFPDVTPLVCATSNCNSPSSIVYTSATATLSGYSVATFGASQAAGFTTAMAGQMSVNSSAITITAVSDVSVRRRQLLSAGVAVAFTVQTTMAQQAAMRAAIVAPLSAAAFRSAGLTAVTSVTAAPSAATSTPSTPLGFAASPPPPPPPPPPPSPTPPSPAPPPATSGGVSRCGAAVVALLAALAALVV